MSIPILTPSHVFGLKSDVSNNIFFIDEQTIIYPSGTQIIIYNIEQKTQRFLSIFEGDGMTSMNVNPSNGLAAVAVKGERPAIIICDLRTLKKKKILQPPDTIQAKEFISVTFSTDGKHVLAQSAGPDCFRSTNNFNSEVHQMSCNPFDVNTQICITGASLYRIFKFTEGIFKLFHQQKPERTLLCHSYISDVRVISGSDDGHILIFEGGDLLHEFAYTSHRNLNSSLLTIAVISSGVLIGTSNGLCVQFEKTDDATLYKKVKEYYTDDSSVGTIAVGFSEDMAVCTLQNSQIFLVLLDSDSSKGDEIRCDRLTQPFHHGQVVGMDTCARKPLLATCGSDKSVRIWNIIENIVEVVKYFDDEPQSIAMHPSGLYVLVGFNDSLKLLNVLIDDIRPYWSANIRGCRECRFSHGGQYFASVYGSTINVHSTWSFESICTLKGHQGKVRSINWSQDDSRLVTCGMDGALIDWNIRTSKREGDLTLKSKGHVFASATYTSDSKYLYAVASDSVIREISIEGHVLREFTTKIPFTQPTSKGTIRTIKYPFSTDCQLDYVEQSCHSAAITRLRISFDDQYLFSCSEDGSVWLYRIQDREVPRGGNREKDWTYSDEILVTKSDLKDNVRVMNEFKEKVEDLKLENDDQLRLKDLNYTEKLREITEKYLTEIEGLKQLTFSIKQERENNDSKHNKELGQSKFLNRREIKEIDQNFKSKMEAESEKYEALYTRMQELQQQWEAQVKDTELYHNQKVTDASVYYRQKLEDKQNEISELKSKLTKQNLEFTNMLGEVEEDTETEIIQIQHGFESKLREERHSLGVIRTENNEMRKKFETLTREIEDHKIGLNKMFTEERRIHSIIKGLEKDIVGMQERDDTILDKEKRIYDLKKKNQELEKFKFVLDYKIMELKKQIEPREKDIISLSLQIKDMDEELLSYHKSHGDLDTVIQDLSLKLQAVDREALCEKWRAREIRSTVRRVHTDVKELYKFLKSSNNLELKRHLVNIFKRYETIDHEPSRPPRDQIVSVSKSENTYESILHEEEIESLRKREHLEGTVATLQQKINKTEEAQHRDNLRIMKEHVTLLHEINTLRKDLKSTNFRTLKLMEPLNGVKRNGLKTMVALSPIQHNEDTLKGKLDDNLNMNISA
ncbi:Cilia- and flagella-associated protein 57 [Nowakowskiella sp. JEL0078]|nr:Cilia- and flagella-associated protein 57 [Nowakowskiella sp. JEL0078]